MKLEVSVSNIMAIESIGFNFSCVLVNLGIDEDTYESTIIETLMTLSVCDKYEHISVIVRSNEHGEAESFIITIDDYIVCRLLTAISSLYNDISPYATLIKIAYDGIKLAVDKRSDEFESAMLTATMDKINRI